MGRKIKGLSISKLFLNKMSMILYSQDSLLIVTPINFDNLNMHVQN